MRGSLQGMQPPFLTVQRTQAPDERKADDLARDGPGQHAAEEATR